MEHLKCETTTVEKFKLAFNNGHLWVCSSNEIKKCVFNNVFVKVLLCPICDSEERCLPCGWKFLSGDLYIIGGQLCGGLRVYIYLLMPCCPMPRPADRCVYFVLYVLTNLKVLIFRWTGIWSALSLLLIHLRMSELWNLKERKTADGALLNLNIGNVNFTHNR